MCFRSLFKELRNDPFCPRKELRNDPFCPPLTNDDGVTVSDQVQYSSFGRIVGRTGSSDTPFLYHGETGVKKDSSGLYHMRARFYHPRLMRFLNADPIGFAGGYNWYSAFENNPLKYVDPNGLRVEFAPGQTRSQINSILDLNRATMAGSETHASNWMQLVNSEHTYYVAAVTQTNLMGNSGQFNHYSRTLIIDPSLHMIVKSTNEPLTTEEIWGHEVSHAAQFDRSPDQFLRDFATAVWQTVLHTGKRRSVRREEVRATEEENQISAELGRKGRKNYFDIDGSNPVLRSNKPGK